VALASSQRESRAALEDLASSQRESRAALEARWTAEREELASSHAAELDKQNEAFEARLRDGREAFEAQLASSEHRFAEERRNLHARLEGNAEELLRSEESWKLSQEEALRGAWERGSSQQRRLAAAFKAARCVSSAKEAELLESHEHLARRFASRESRSEDVQAIGSQRKQLDSQERELRDREFLVRDLSLQLENRDVTDRLFSSPDHEIRRRGGQALPESCGGNFGASLPRGAAPIIPPLPGKKVGDTRSFPERRLRRGSREASRDDRGGSRASIAGRASSAGPRCSAQVASPLGLLAPSQAFVR